MSKSTIMKSAFFAVAPETMWAYLTEADKLGEWFHPAEKDLSAGNDYALIATNVNGENSPIITGKVLIWEKPNKLKYTFEIGPFGGVVTTVTWQLEVAHGGTKLSLTHEGIGELGDASLDLLMALDDGWDEHIGSLRKTLKDNDRIEPDCAKE